MEKTDESKKVSYVLYYQETYEIRFEKSPLKSLGPAVNIEASKIF